MKISSALVLISIVLISALAGFCIHNYPLIQWKQEVTIAEAANFCLTLAIGALIPVYIYKSIDNRRSQKQEVIDDCKGALEEVKKVKQKIDECYANGTITPADKIIINSKFEEAQDKIYNLVIYLEIIFRDKSVTIHNEISQTYDDYWRTVTAGNLMSTTYTIIDSALQSDQTSKWGIFEQAVKKTILEIHRS